MTDTHATEQVGFATLVLSLVKPALSGPPANLAAGTATGFHFASLSRDGLVHAFRQALALHGVFVDGASGRTVHWQVHRTVPGLIVFLGIGVLAGMFGMGAGWANVPALNLLMGAPVKVAAGTSGLVLSLVDSSAAWVYINQGAVLPLIAVPSVVGMMLGARIGARLLTVLKGAVIRRMVIAVLLFAGARALLKGTGIWP